MLLVSISTRELCGGLSDDLWITVWYDVL
jgi:hypothetical protein